MVFSSDAKTTSIVFLATACFCLIISFKLLEAFVYPQLSRKHAFHKSKTWVGPRKEMLSSIRAQFRAITGMGKNLAEGYDKYCKSGKAFLTPLFGSQPLLIMPPSKVKMVCSLPEEQIDASSAQFEMVMASYTLGDDISGPKKSHHLDIARRQLTRKLGSVMPLVADEVDLAFKDTWGIDADSWNSISLYESCTRIVSRAANRAFVGEPLCRNTEFLDACLAFAQGSFTTGSITRLFPKFTWPMIAPLVAYFSNRHKETAIKHSLPVIEKELRQRREKGLDSASEIGQTGNALTWLIEEAERTNDPAQLHPRILARRLLAVQMVALHTTSMATTNALLDVYSSPQAEAIVAALREECQRVLASNGNRWNKELLDKLVRHDSAIRESMRISGLASLGIIRQVSAKDGVDFGDGIVVPQGVRTALPVNDIHLDTAIYGPNARTYDPFRFSAPWEVRDANMQKSGPNGAGHKPTSELRNQSLVTTSTDFLGFGHGLHACPGRFFASDEMKLILAYVVMHYDVRSWSKRPENMSVSEFIIPRHGIKAEVRRRL